MKKKSRKGKVLLLAISMEKHIMLALNFIFATAGVRMLNSNIFRRMMIFDEVLLVQTCMNGRIAGKVG